ncbi:MAG TPA: hypothetical protein VK464_06815, partial [Symbiobacteriaceae bacterium]|nr:hypothetical protein [Symbiobacteriaceae bacterium]
MARYFAFPWRVGQRALYAALFLSMAALLLLVPARPARADEPCTITLVDNAATVYWINSSSWDQQRLPGPDDFVCIPAGNPGAEVWIQDDMATLRGIRSERTLVLVRSWLTLTDAAVPSVIDGLLDLRDGNLDNQTTLTVTHLALEQGALGGSGRTIVPPGGTLEVPGLPNERLWDGHTLVNQGTATFTNAGLYIQQGARFINQGTATFNAGTVWSNGQDYPTAPSGLIVNTGTLVKTGSGDTLTLQVPLNNTGTVRVEQGALELRTPGAPQGGEFVVDGQLSFSNPDTTHVFGAGASVHGVGQLVVNGSTVAMGGSYNMAETTALAGQLTLEQPATLATVNVYGGTVLAQADLAVNSANLNGGTLLAQANLAVTNGWLFGGTLESNGTTSLHQVNWFKGTLGGSGRTIIPSDGTIFINPYDFTTWKAIADGHTVEIQGTGHSSQALLTLGAGATLLNRGTLYLTATEAALGQISSLDGSGTLLNEGMLHITGTYTASANLVNAGIIQVNLGTLRLDNGAEHTGTFVVHDTLSFSGGTHRLAAGSAVSGFGTVVLTDGTLQVDGDYTVAGTEVRAGNLAPGVPLTFNAVVVNGGRLQADVPTTVSHLTLSSGTLAGT